jgi:hypothetical protein
MLRVYWTCPGASATMNLRFAVAKKRYATAIVMPCSRSAVRPSEQPADQRALAVVDAARGEKPQHAVVDRGGEVARRHQK